MRLVLAKPPARGQSRHLVSGSRDVAAVVSAEDLKILEALEGRLDLQEARQIMKKPGRLVSWEKIKKDLGL